MAEYSYPWVGDSGSGGVGDCGPYTSDVEDLISEILWGGDAATEGVIPNWPVVTAGAKEFFASVNGLVLTIKPGAAVVKGKLHWSDADWTYTFTRPVSGTRYDRFVLRAYWTLGDGTYSRRVRIYRIAGLPALPPIVQTHGTEWHLPLYTVAVPSGAGALTITKNWAYRHLRNVTDNKYLETTRRWHKGMLIDWSGTLGGSDGARPVDPVTGRACESWHACIGGPAHNGVVIPDLRDLRVLAAGPNHAAHSSGGVETINNFHYHWIYLNTGAAAGTVGIIGTESVDPERHAESEAPHSHQIDVYASQVGGTAVSVVNPFYAVAAKLIYVGLS